MDFYSVGNYCISSHVSKHDSWRSTWDETVQFYASLQKTCKLINCKDLNGMIRIIDSPTITHNHILITQITKLILVSKNTAMDISISV